MHSDVLGLIHEMIKPLREFGLAGDTEWTRALFGISLQCPTLEATHQLESLFRGDSSQVHSYFGESLKCIHQSDRLGKVARKDSLWFLCYNLQLMLSSSVAHSGCSSDPELETCTGSLDET